MTKEEKLKNESVNANPISKVLQDFFVDVVKSKVAREYWEETLKEEIVFTCLERKPTHRFLAWVGCKRHAPLIALQS